jgi:hypothetical protein
VIRHVFLWRVAPTADPAEIVRILNELPERLKVIRTWSVGKHQGEPGNSGAPWEYALTCDFDSMADLDAYSNDPFHQEVVAKLMPMFSDRAVCDFEL